MAEFELIKQVIKLDYVVHSFAGLWNHICREKNAYISSPTTTILPTTVGTFHGLNCFSLLIYILQNSTYLHIVKLWTDLNWNWLWDKFQKSTSFRVSSWCNGYSNGLQISSKQVQALVAQLHWLSDKYPWERYEPPYPLSYVLNSTTIVLLKGWIWH